MAVPLQPAATRLPAMTRVMRLRSRTHLLRILGVWPVLLSAAASQACVPRQALDANTSVAEWRDDSLEVQLQVGRAYTIGDTVRWRVRMTNRTNRTLELLPTDGRLAPGYAVTDSAGRVISNSGNASEWSPRILLLAPSDTLVRRSGWVTRYTRDVPLAEGRYYVQVRLTFGSPPHVDVATPRPFFDIVTPRAMFMLSLPPGGGSRAP